MMRVHRARGTVAGGRSRRDQGPVSTGPMTVTATYQGTETARSDHTVVVEGNHYFPLEDVRHEVLQQPSATHTICPWKGEASYYEVVVDDLRGADAPAPMGTASSRCSAGDGRVIALVHGPSRSRPLRIRFASQRSSSLDPRKKVAVA